MVGWVTVPSPASSEESCSDLGFGTAPFRRFVAFQYFWSSQCSSSPQLLSSECSWSPLVWPGLYARNAPPLARVSRSSWGWPGLNDRKAPPLARVPRSPWGWPGLSARNAPPLARAFTWTTSCWCCNALAKKAAKSKDDGEFDKHCAELMMEDDGEQLVAMVVNDSWTTCRRTKGRFICCLRLPCLLVPVSLSSHHLRPGIPHGPHGGSRMLTFRPLSLIRAPA